LRLSVCFSAAAVAVLLLGPASADARAGPPAPDTPLDAELFPLGHEHLRRCWHLEHDYYALREQIAHIGVVWRRQRLEQQWEDVRDRRRETCLMGW
jgi:hypothetical protein